MKRRLIEITILATVLGAAALRFVAIENAREKLHGNHVLDGKLEAVHDLVASLLRQQDSPLAQTFGTSTNAANFVEIAESISSEWNQLRSEGVETITLERFDPAAVVVMRPGPDRQPGVAGIDDNGDGLVDNVTELGATGSDDVCLVESPTDLQAEPGRPALVLDRGAFVPATFAQAVAGPSPARAIVTGKTASDRWSLMVEFDAQAL